MLISMRAGRVGGAVLVTVLAVFVRKRLCGFERVALAPGEKRTVRIALAPGAFSLWDAQMKEVVEPGLVDILAGPSSVDVKVATLEIVKP